MKKIQKNFCLQCFYCGAHLSLVSLPIGLQRSFKVFKTNPVTVQLLNCGFKILHNNVFELIFICKLFIQAEQAHYSVRWMFKNILKVYLM